MRNLFSVSKITPPVLPNVVRRKRLILILGQAAQGKSTLAASFLESTATPSAWVNLREEDSDPVNLYYSIVHSIQYTLKEADLSPLLTYPAMTMAPRSEIPLYREWTSAISESVSTPIWIVLDGMDRFLTDAASSKFIKVLAEDLAGHIHLILISREDPSLDVERLKVRQQVDVLTNEDLAFTLEETRIFFREIRGLPLGSSSLRRIHQFTEGWIGGFILLVESLERMPADSREKYIREDLPDQYRAEVFRYFGEEIFAAQPASVQDFLVKTSILESIEPDFATRFTGVENAGEALEGLVRRGLFVHDVYVEGGDRIFRYHQLFRDFLKAHLERTVSEEDRRSLFLRAASLYEERGEFQKSLKYYLQAEVYSSAAAMIERIGMDVLKQGRTNDLADWLKALPEDLIRKNAWLLFFLCMTRRFTRAGENIPDLRKAFSLFAEQEDLGGQFLSLAYLIEALVYRGNDPAPIRLFIDQAENLLESSPTSTHTKGRFFGS